MNRVLKNLLDNAVKYGSDGKYIGISVETFKNTVCIGIEDHGKGILEKHKENIFERMYTLEDSRSKDYEGSGLGLAICKELVEHMNGKIELTSIPNKKTLFNIILPKGNSNSQMKNSCCRKLYFAQKHFILRTCKLFSNVSYAIYHFPSLDSIFIAKVNFPIY
ncbi:sensor histidine kinase (plasmid) [Haloimpatiens sp. FM7330]|uniref:sensor histidine kinase n=1 Tax=Haloimpatiens sp. FM7330 TaxID=3298610 RepID=UPI00363A2F89